ncbi:hypothetical protein TRFO_42877 [Tritrichomonas foetus]|uniref:Uncharacterized protein n=1 Tax=Tritrichomonas foetus TaxID=1144522 RepID=A0A1J4KYM4_9EUKA|nr:hypothetical protein TRFO_42877 [Tritrichomonas foetus]|eukprot:OHT14806.1 hypothetical protein TRFO_42877 [Tritrichomonas foetus]
MKGGDYNLDFSVENSATCNLILKNGNPTPFIYAGYSAFIKGSKILPTQVYNLRDENEWTVPKAISLVDNNNEVLTIKMKEDQIYGTWMIVTTIDAKTLDEYTKPNKDQHFYNTDKLPPIAIVIELQGAVPLNDHQNLNSNTFIIYARPGDIITCYFSDDKYNDKVALYIPFRRTSNEDVRAKFIKMLTIPNKNSAMCTETDLIDAFYHRDSTQLIPFGCVEYTNEESSKNNLWNSFVNYGEMKGFNVLINHHDYVSESKDFIIHTWNLNLRSDAATTVPTIGTLKAEPYPVLITIPENQRTVNIEDLLIQKINRCSFLVDLYFKCDRCDKVVVESLDESIYEDVTDQENGLFKFRFKENKDIPKGITIGSEFTADHVKDPKYTGLWDYSLKEDKTYLAKYSDVGVKDLIPPSLQKCPLFEVVQSQIITGVNVLHYEKNWDGVIQYTEITGGDIKIEVTPIKIENDVYTSIKAKLGQLNIPFSPEKFINDAINTFTSLGVTYPETNTSNEAIASYTQDGSLLINDKYFTYQIGDSGKSTKQIIDFKTFFDIPANLITNVKMECSSESFVVNGKCSSVDAPTPDIPTDEDTNINITQDEDINITQDEDINITQNNSSNDGPDDSGSDEPKSKLGSGAIAGIVIGVIVVVAIAVVLVIYFVVCRRKKERSTSSNNNGDETI